MPPLQFSSFCWCHASGMDVYPENKLVIFILCWCRAGGMGLYPVYFHKGNQLFLLKMTAFRKI